MTKPKLQRPSHVAKRGPLGKYERNKAMLTIWETGTHSTYDLARVFGLNPKRVQYIVKRERTRSTGLAQPAGVV